MNENFKYKIKRIWRKKKGKKPYIKMNATFKVKLKYNQALFEIEDSNYKIIFRMYVFEKNDFKDTTGFSIKHLDNDYAIIELTLMTGFNQKRYDQGEIDKITLYYELDNKTLSIKARIIPLDMKKMMGQINIDSINKVKFPGTKKKAPYVGRKKQYISVYQGGGCGGK